jgi:nicotinamidase-related amidase
MSNARFVFLVLVLLLAIGSVGGLAAAQTTGTPTGSGSGMAQTTQSPPGTATLGAAGIVTGTVPPPGQSPGVAAAEATQTLMPPVPGIVTDTTGMTGTMGMTGTTGMPMLPEPVAVQLDSQTTALLVLDITETICQPRGSCTALVPTISDLVTRAREAGVLVIYSNTPSMPSGAMPSGSSTITPSGTTTTTMSGSAGILSDVAPEGDEQVVTGPADKFYQTNLDEMLQDREIKTVVVVGYAAHGAVLYTAYGAAIRGYTVVVPVDTMAAEDPFAVMVARYQLLNQPGAANAQNNPPTAGRVTLTSSDLITFGAFPAANDHVTRTPAAGTPTSGQAPNVPVAEVTQTLMPPVAPGVVTTPGSSGGASATGTPAP